MHWPRGHQVFSIEVQPRLEALAVKRFQHTPEFTMVQGDSALVFQRMVPTPADLTLFWLDGDFSGGQTEMGSLEIPVVAEVECVLRDALSGSIVYVDDARCFGVLPD